MNLEDNNRIAYLGTGKHGDGIVLRPLFYESGGIWKNATTGREAPKELADAFSQAVATSPEGSGESQKARLDEHGVQSRDADSPTRVLESINWAQRCEGLTRIVESFSWAPRLEDVYLRLCETSSELFKSSQSHLHISSVDGSKLTKIARYTGNNPVVDTPSTLPASVGRTTWILDNLSPISTDYEHPACEDVVPKGALEAGIKSSISIPLASDGRCIGMLTLVYQSKTIWTEEDIEYLIMVGRIIGTMLKRTLDTKKATELQVLNERKLLSTEIHENVSSLIGALAINAAAAIEALEDADKELARADLARLESTAAETMRILRDEMFSLRIDLEDTDSLIDGMRDCLGGFQKNWGIQTSLSITGPCIPVVVPTRVSLQLTRILNECLSNSLRHSGADKVEVEMRSESDLIAMTVKDNGCGFDVDSIGSDHFGLKIMKERALSVSGRFSIISNCDGTTVRVEVPNRRTTRETK